VERTFIAESKWIIISFLIIDGSELDVNWRKENENNLKIKNKIPENFLRLLNLSSRFFDDGVEKKSKIQFQTFLRHFPNEK